PNLDRVLLGPLLVERDLVVAGHCEPERVADGRHPDAKVRGAPAVHSDVNLGVREVEGDLGVGEAWHLLRRKERAFGVLGNLLEIRAQYVCRDGEAAGALAAAERVA